MAKIACPSSLFSKKKKIERAAILDQALQALYPDAACALDFQGDPFRLLVMARLSAQCTDRRVNEVSQILFQELPNAHAFANVDLARLEDLIRPCGLYHAKAVQIQELSRILLRDYDGKVPADKTALLALPGVGEKIANLMMGDVFGDPHIVADTHCIRLAGRFGLADSADPKKVTDQLEKIIQKERQADFCHRLITLGREYCKAIRPRCDECPLNKTAYHKEQK